MHQHRDLSVFDDGHQHGFVGDGSLVPRRPNGRWHDSVSADTTGGGKYCSKLDSVFKRSPPSKRRLSSNWSSKQGRPACRSVDRTVHVSPQRARGRRSSPMDLLLAFVHVFQTRVATASRWLGAGFPRCGPPLARTLSRRFQPPAAFVPTNKDGVRRGVQARASSSRVFAMIFDGIRDDNQTRLGYVSARYGYSPTFPTLTRGRMLLRGWRRCIGTAQPPRASIPRPASSPR